MNNAPGLGDLGHHDGPTPNLEPLPGSPQLDAGNANGLQWDQRGTPWSRVSGAQADIGAVERNLDIIFRDGFDYAW